MRKLTRLKKSTKKIFIDCASKTREPKKRRLLAVSNVIDSAAKAYLRRGRLNKLHETQQDEIIGSDVTKSDMGFLYETHFVRKGSIGRPTYDTILAQPKHRKCPLCCIRTATTLDHFLPKAAFPKLALTPANLVPACRDCNTNKLDAFEGDATKLTMHPYFDDFESERWLNAEIIEQNPLGVRYLVGAPSSWEQTKIKRAEHHFKLLQLGGAYASNAVTEIGNIQSRLEKLFSQGEVNAVRSHLQEEFESRHEAQLNSWETALYESMLQSDWFCKGGFRNL